MRHSRFFQVGKERALAGLVSVAFSPQIELFSWFFWSVSQPWEHDFFGQFAIRQTKIPRERRVVADEEDVSEAHNRQFWSRGNYGTAAPCCDTSISMIDCLVLYFVRCGHTRSMRFLASADCSASCSGLEHIHLMDSHLNWMHRGNMHKRIATHPDVVEAT